MLNEKKPKQNKTKQNKKQKQNKTKQTKKQTNKHVSSFSYACYIMDIFSGSFNNLIQNLPSLIICYIHDSLSVAGTSSSRSLVTV